MQGRGRKDFANSPPAYAVSDRESFAGPSRLNSGFSTFSLSEAPQHPEVNSCLAHLKLLFTFHNLKEDVGYTDGLWGLWDSSYPATPTNPNKALAIIREKRWALYVARAVDRYEAWWNTLGGQFLTERDMEKDRTRYLNFMANWEPMNWSEDAMPPLDVLLVLHAHMLNPRLFLEDCLRYGHRALWTTGLPLHILDNMIDPSSHYVASESCKSNWTQKTGLEWYNTSDPMVKTIRCPACSAVVDIPWTTCSQHERPDAKFPPPRPNNLVGKGFGDGDLNHPCPRCGIIIDHELNRLSKFRNDAKDLVNNDQPLPGTILDSKTGMPTEASRSDSPRLFPNRLLRRGVLAQVVDLLKPGDERRPSMSMVKDIIETAIKDQALLKRTNGGRKPNAAARQQIRKMMSRYWDNSSPFALELVGAVLRQGIFTQKMYKIDWLHSPEASQSMARLLRKYGRFFQIMVQNPDQVVVPTLDVDLAWHTHQLSPRHYYNYARSKTGSFTDHQDKVDEDKLSAAFEWTSSTYMTMYQEVYSECVCWYCETIRAWRVSAFSAAFNASKPEKISQAWYDSGAAYANPPSTSAHISTHAAVKVNETEARRKVTRHMRALYRSRLEQNYAKAVKRANKKGRDLGPRERKYRHWGYNHVLEGPWSHPHYLEAAMYATDPTRVNAGDGVPGGCVAATCGGSAGCGSGTLSMCGTSGPSS
ncbi:uncharacterized protein JN550_004449 [Neoarthrinium moseri]|uniref:uncharacterized protein n=1 Tax=Neoarthrinium moseri TaxID=1658444 RepID=UPI001FDB520A|nr:uncharacterized protein JN550_004449 [Neoarthrinium moseri]KAI1871455.1 hypothetical protein JN550_004449 [Neoarthrinium moseri]